MKQIVAALTVSTLICAACLCFLLHGTSNYSNVESAMPTATFSTNAEDTNTPPPLDFLDFDDSVWGRIAKAIKRGIDAWQD